MTSLFAGFFSRTVTFAVMVSPMLTDGESATPDRDKSFPVLAAWCRAQQKSGLPPHPVMMMW
ncbi:MAG: hypothetical protein WDN50_12850 [Bradyrhizobium sp.]